MIDSSENIPFDISDLRTIYYDFDVSSASKAKKKIREQLEMIEEEEPTFDNPISQSVDLKSWRESEDPIQQNLADILDGIRTLNNRIDDTNSKIEDLPYRTKAQPRYSKEPFEFTKPVELETENIELDIEDFDLSDSVKENVAEEFEEDYDLIE